MAYMIYASKKGKKIIFDDYSDNAEDDSYWVEMCKHCHNKYRGILGNRADDGGTAPGICSVKGCENEAHYYVDFSNNEVIIATTNTRIYNSEFSYC